MASSKRRMTSSIVPRQNSLPATVTYLVALFGDPHDLASFAIVARQTRDALRQFPLDLIKHGRKYTQRQLSALFIQPGYWKPTTVMMLRSWGGHLLPSPSSFLRKVAIYQYNCLDILKGLIFLEVLGIYRKYPHPLLGRSEFVFGQWASNLTKVTLNDPHVLILPSLAHLPNIGFLDLTGCRRLKSVAPLVVCESLITLIINGCSDLTTRGLWTPPPTTTTPPLD
jgi:hypothetical protein